MGSIEVEIEASVADEDEVLIDVDSPADDEVVAFLKDVNLVPMGGYFDGSFPVDVHAGKHS